MLFTRQLGRNVIAACRLHNGSHNNISQSWQALEYGNPDMLHLNPTLQTPTIRTPLDVLIKVHASSMNPLDVMMLKGYGATIFHYFRGLYEFSLSPKEFPLILGRDFSGTVVQTGNLVRDIKVGDEVFGIVGAQRPGSHASYVTTPSAYVSKKPMTLTHAEAASLPYAGLTAWAALSTFGGLSQETTSRKRIAVFGGSGGIGTIAIQILRTWGASVTATCATDAVDLVESLGVEDVIDYTQQDVREALQASEKFDFILDTVNGDSYKKCLDLLKKWRNSVYVTTVSPTLKNADQYGLIPGTVKSLLEAASDTFMSMKDGRSYRWAYVLPNCWALKKIADMADKKQILPVIDKVFSFEETPEAYKKMLEGHARGKIVIDHMAPVEVSNEKDVEETPELMQNSVKA